MYYRPETQDVFTTHSEIRNAMKHVWFTDIMDDETLAFHGVFPLVSNKPDAELPMLAKPTTVEEIDGVWTQQWEIVEATEEELQALKPIVPQKVTRRQARQALALRSTAEVNLLEAVPATIAAITDPVKRTLAQIEWEDSLEFDRTRPLVIEIGGAIGLDSDGLDDLFIFASTL